MENLRHQVATTQKRIKLVYALLAAGLMVEMAYIGIGVALAVSTGGYLANTKATRDAAEAGSGLLSQAGTIAAISTWIEPFKFVGIALFFLAIAAALSAIVQRIRLRGLVMAEVVPALMRDRSQQSS